MTTVLAPLTSSPHAAAVSAPIERRRARRGAKAALMLVGVGMTLIVALDGGLPATMAVYATNVARPARARVTPADRGLAYQDATFTTSDGVRLSGWYIPSRNGAAIVALHGASSTRTSVLDQAAVLA